jgi:hypothetical protein
LLLALACAASPGGASRLERVPPGEWGGQHVRLTVQDAGGTVEFDCAHGRLRGPWTLDPQGRFDVPGTLVAEGGPTRKDAVGEGRPARYRGETNGDRMSLELMLEGGESAGSFTLVRNGRARLVKCR